MELTEQEARLIKRIYDKYYAEVISADEALNNLEQLINNDTEEN
jgi:hypothetical protein